MEKRLLSLVQVGLVGISSNVGFLESDRISCTVFRFEEHDSKNTYREEQQRKMPIHRLINKIPIQNENLRIFVGACIFTGIICIPKAMGGRTFLLYRDERNSNRVAFLKFAINAGTRPGHGYFDSETPEDVKIARENHSSSK